MEGLQTELTELEGKAKCGKKKKKKCIVYPPA